MAYGPRAAAASQAEFHGELAAVLARRQPEHDPAFVLLQAAIEYLDRNGECYHDLRSVDVSFSV
jgi:hypothetical protein